jgi:hypothetical protein
VLDLQTQLLLAARDAQGPGAVTEVTAELTEDRRHGEAGERRLPFGVEAVDRIQEADGSDLLEVVDRLRGVAVAGGEPVREREVALDHCLMVGRGAAGAQAYEELSPVVEGRPFHTFQDDRTRSRVTQPVAPTAR